MQKPVNAYYLSKVSKMNGYTNKPLFELTYRSGCSSYCEGQG